MFAMLWLLSMYCHAKIGSAGLILAEKPAKTGPPRTTFAAKIGPAGPILAAKNGPLLPKSVLHGGPILAKNYLPKLVPPQSGTVIPAHIHGYMDVAIISSYAWLSS